MQLLLLIFEHHNLIQTFPHERFLEPVENVFWIRLVDDLYQMVLFKFLENGIQRFTCFFMKRQYFQKSSGAKVFANHGCHLECHDAFDEDVSVVLILFQISLHQELVEVFHSSFVNAVRNRDLRKILKQLAILKLFFHDNFELLVNRS